MNRGVEIAAEVADLATACGNADHVVRADALAALARVAPPQARGHLAAALADRYRVEPYVIAADVYGAPPHTGRGGWTWYTGSAGWMYRLIVESLLGLTLEVDRQQIGTAREQHPDNLAAVPRVAHLPSDH